MNYQVWVTRYSHIFKHLYGQTLLDIITVNVHEANIVHYCNENQSLYERLYHYKEFKLSVAQLLYIYMQKFVSIFINSVMTENFHSLRNIFVNK